MRATEVTRMFALVIGVGSFCVAGAALAESAGTAAGGRINTADAKVDHTATTTTTTTKKHTKSAKALGDAKGVGDKPDEKVVAADDTGINKRDRAENAATADSQKNNKSDVELAAEIRRAVVKDKALSTNAHNIKIIVVDGQVTLKGPVASKAERVSVEKKAREIAGAGKVTSEVDIAP